MSEIAALFLSFGLIFIIIGIASLLLTLKLVSAEISRKIIHIGVSNWWLLAMFTMEHTLIAIIGPVSFIIINYISYRRHLFPAMEDDAPHDNLGTIYFPISLLILVLLCYSGPLSLTAGAAGILVMGYGDGAAALVGKHLGRKKISLGPFHTEKTVLGTATMLTVSYLVIVLVAVYLPPLLSAGQAAAVSEPWAWALFVAAAAALIELFTPRGLDNITVPIAAALLFWMVPL